MVRAPFRRGTCGGACQTPPMIRQPTVLRIDDQGRVELLLGLLAESGLSPGASLLAFSDGDGRTVLRQAEHAVRDPLENGTL